MKNKVYIGVDLGGTKIMTGAVDVSGRVYQTPVKVSTGGDEPAENIVSRIVDSINKTLSAIKIDKLDAAGIGIGSTGPLSIKEGTILDCPQLPTMKNYSLRQTVENVFNIPVYLNNDANCLIYGETIFGAARGMKNVLGFTLGTGIGSAIILNGKIWNGATETAGEIWTSPYRDGIIEDYISGKGVSKIYESLSGKQLSSLEVFNLAENGNAEALKTWSEFGEHLSVALSWSVNLIDPEAIVLGGSIASAAKFFMPSLEKKFRQFLCAKPATETKILLADLGGYAGFIGAACLVIENQ